MKSMIVWAFFVSLFFAWGCSKDDNPSVTVSQDEQKLLGKWDVHFRITQSPGLPPDTLMVNDPLRCFMEFIEGPSAIIAASPSVPVSSLYHNTKRVQDNKQCTWLMNAWKIMDNGQLLLMSLDTSFADILYLTPDSLIFRTESSVQPGTYIVYGLKKS